MRNSIRNCVDDEVDITDHCPIRCASPLSLNILNIYAPPYLWSKSVSIPTSLFLGGRLTTIQQNIHLVSLLVWGNTATAHFPS